MCGRYTQGKAIPNLIERYAALGLERVAEEQGLLPRFNIAPGQLAGVIHVRAGERVLGPMRWGLVPHWAKSLEGLKHRPINAQSEKADTGPFFRESFRSGRCLVPATGFYEWKGAKPPKQPFYIRVADQEVFSFAGLWATWQGPGGEVLETFAVLTTAANSFMQEIHHRMPCILTPAEEEAWLAEDTPVEAAKGLLNQYAPALMTAYPVSTAVNKVTSEGEALTLPVATGDSPGGGQLSLFGDGE